MSNILIIKGGLLSTLQDGGRIGYQQFGIPVAGAMDQYALQLGNMLVGNHRLEAGIEFTLVGPTIKFNDNRVFAITGGDFQPTLNGRAINMYQSIGATEGDELKFSSVKTGCRGYLTIAGGFDVEKVMGSLSTYLRGGFGGFGGEKLKDGDLIPLNPISGSGVLEVREIPAEMIPKYNKKRNIRVIMGSEVDGFSEKGIRTFLEEEYVLSNQCDRMGYRLEGPLIQHVKGADIVSGGINLGAIQVPGDGKPIIMMVDHQTTGGYTKIANVISTDIPYLAQMKPGDCIRFEEVTVEEAHQLLHQQENKIINLMNYFNQLKITGVRDASKKRFNVKVNGKVYSVLIEEKLT